MTTIKIGIKVKYQVERDNQGGMWIEGTPRIAKFPVDGRILDLYKRDGHISFNTILSLPECPKPSPEWKEPRCTACEAGKTTKPPSLKRKHAIRTTRSLERIHADLVESIKPVTSGNQYQYLLVVVHDHRWYVSVELLKRKNDAGDTLIEIINSLENATNLQTNQVQADWGGNFRNKELAIELKPVRNKPERNCAPPQRNKRNSWTNELHHVTWAEQSLQLQGYQNENGIRYQSTLHTPKIESPTNPPKENTYRSTTQQRGKPGAEEPTPFRTKSNMFQLRRNRQAFLPKLPGPNCGIHQNIRNLLGRGLEEWKDLTG